MADVVGSVVATNLLATCSNRGESIDRCTRHAHGGTWVPGTQVLGYPGIRVPRYLTGAPLIFSFFRRPNSSSVPVCCTCRGVIRFLRASRRLPQQPRALLCDVRAALISRGPRNNQQTLDGTENNQNGQGTRTTPNRPWPDRKQSKWPGGLEPPNRPRL